MREPILEVKNLKKHYQGKPVVTDLSLHVYPGEVVGLLGPNGAGKTTAFYMTIGLIQPDSGAVFLNGKEITEKPVHTRAKLGMGYLSQEPSIFRSMTVEENILSVLETLPLSKKERANQLFLLLRELHLDKLSKKKASMLSGGERRRLEITRALVTSPSLLLLDEPFANIDPISVSDVKKIIRMLKARGIGILITDHNAREIFSIATRSYLVQAGSVLATGTVDELLQNQEARASYFGTDFKL